MTPVFWGVGDVQCFHKRETSPTPASHAAQGLQPVHQAARPCDAEEPAPFCYSSYALRDLFLRHCRSAVEIFTRQVIAVEPCCLPSSREVWGLIRPLPISHLAWAESHGTCRELKPTLRKRAMCALGSTMARLKTPSLTCSPGAHHHPIESGAGLLSCCPWSWRLFKDPNVGFASDLKNYFSSGLICFLRR